MFSCDVMMDHEDANSLPGVSHAASPENDRYVVVARRYRPQSFEELVGQEYVRKALANAIETNRVGHAYLFAGPRGTGKTTTARIFAKALNCSSGPTMTPCNQCNICVDISSDADVDVIEIDGASNNSVDDIRELRDNCTVRPARCRFKIYIIDEVHMLSKSAFNALLKTLEEPPEHVKFMFCTTDPDKLPITVLSRCQRFDLSTVEESKIFDRLKFILDSENRKADDAAVSLLARRAYGSLRDSQSLLEQLLSFCSGTITIDDVHQLLGTTDSGKLLDLLESLAARDAGRALGLLNDFWKVGTEPERLAEQILGIYRDLLSASVGCAADLMHFTQLDEFSRVQEIAKQYGKHTLLASMEVMQEMLRRVQATTKVKILVETAIVRLASLEELDRIEEWLDVLQSPQMKDFARSGLVIAPGGSASVTAASQKKNDVTPPPTSPGVHGGPARLVTPVVNADQQAKSAVADAGSPSIASDVSKPSPISGNPAVAQGSVVQRQPSEISGSTETPSDSQVQPERILTVTNQNVLAVWERACQNLDDLTASTLQSAETVAISVPNHLVVKFPSRYTFQKDACERPERRAKLEDELYRTTGSRFRVTFELLPETAQPQTVEQASGVKTTRQRRREAEKHPMVQQAMETFGAEVVRVDHPRKRQ